MNPQPLREEESFDGALERASQGRFREAIDGVTGALHQAPDHPHTRARAAEALARIGRLAETAAALDHAEAALAEATRLAPTHADLHYRLACVRLLAGKRAEARRALGVALSLNPRYLAARLEMALLDAREGRLGEALDTLRKLESETAVEEPRVFGRGLRSLEHAEWEEAGTLLRQALRLGDPVLQDAIQEFHGLMRGGERLEAARRMREALREREAYPDLHCLLGLAELEEGHLDDALASFARALELHPDYHLARVQLARTLEALGDLAQAEDQVALVLHADPANPQALALRERWSRHPRWRATESSEARKAS